ncbi:flagellar hook-length control protein FliK [Comamonas sp. NLF-1-9]|uniref:flagellar hook-length control protein FliK n=1 Tax=Comamonas sp. NLF-1-9 TaxID=2853163 RepID=UPI001C48D80D|nr:flagellar hook-length control protein FliK [Comamonas sp. NLF-1-9]QXL84265.1 flagellar hook-length control protein FliK [Comamonas sp. NLF-1-9]
MDPLRMPPAQPQPAAQPAPQPASQTTAQAATQAAAAETGARKQGAQEPGEARDGFALLLAALGAGAAPDLPGDGALVPAAPGSGAPAEADAAVVQALDAHAQGLPLPEHLALLLQQGQHAQAGRAQAAGGAELARSQPSEQARQQQAIVLLGQELHAQVGQGLAPSLMSKETAQIDASQAPAPGARRSPGVALAAAGLGAGAHAALAASGTQAAAASALAAAPGTPADAGAALAELPQGLQALAQSLDKGTDQARVALAPLAAGGRGPESAPSPAAALAGLAHLDGPGRSAGQGANGSGAQQGGAHPGGQGALGAMAQATGDAARAGAAGADAGLNTSFMQELGEQVAFWVHQKSQRAEFTLDRDGQAVQVQVVLAGDVARVNFLSDHEASRLALDAGVEELRSLLQQQGLALADVNVGVAGEQGSAGAGAGQGGGERPAPGRGEGAQARVVAAGEALAPQRPRGDRALDVFV